ncbi:hypothetical protein SARC_06602 [Sphaeroforma arctica JP610]|uniref:Uncharacterized protein n=1 Tax=Sphaeroforma arctica JP610 TaxID=667725 RepID=A0A0L0FW66_9EUKA|nr:hypothetical protein SARC_06602 [Sphaeroforma arctica JP610]KNC81060.1 hypothetical protein SARC_06602 [Sphaeroforma arctica JP610]|eukprot:XP_014154962.1 hypothetical protein SARC_06602 [Sphaeroforma arctica JP610]
MPRRRSTFTDMSPDEQLASSFETAPRGYIHQTRRPSTHSRKSAQNQSQSLFMSALPLVLVPFLVLALSSGVLEADHNTWGRVPYPGGVGRTLMGQSASNEGGGVCIGTPLECAIGLVLGWASSVLYVVSRIPQLYKNYVRKSCEGLSVWMFFFGVIGNLTYSLSIFVKSTEADYLLNSLPYIIGSIGTLGFDLTIFLQFFLYNNAPAGGYDVIN